MADDPHQPTDEVLDALDALVDVLNAASPRAAIEKRARQIRELRTAGKLYSEIAQHEFRPLVVEMVADHLASLAEASARLRRAQAKALHDEGLTMEDIAQRFGVTRQRISQLLRGANGDH